MKYVLLIFQELLGFNIQGLIHHQCFPSRLIFLDKVGAFKTKVNILRENIQVPHRCHKNVFAFLSVANLVLICYIYRQGYIWHIIRECRMSILAFFGGNLDETVQGDFAVCELLDKAKSRAVRFTQQQCLGPFWLHWAGMLHQIFTSIVFLCSHGGVVK